MQRLRKHRPKVPVVLRASYAGAGIALDGMVEIGEAKRVPFCIRSATLTGHRREPRKHWRLLADLGEYLGLGVAGDIVRCGEGPVGAPSLGVHPALRNDLAIEVRYLLDQPDVLQESRTAGTGGENVGVVGDWCTSRIRECLIRHGISLERVSQSGSASSGVLTHQELRPLGLCHVEIDRG